MGKEGIVHYVSMSSCFHLPFLDIRFGSPSDNDPVRIVRWPNIDTQNRI